MIQAVWLVMSSFLVICIILTTTSYATDDYYSNSKRGYWWYEDPLEGKARKEKEEKKREEKRPNVFVPNLTDYSYEQLMGLHPDEFRPLMDAFLKKAVQDPSEDNIREYYVIQDIARRKALAFANVASYVIQKYPYLDVGRDYPMNVPGRDALTRMIANEINTTLNSATNDFGLLYFHSLNCPYCQEQSSILKHFLTRHANWEIKHIDINREPTLAMRFRVDTVPLIILIYRHSRDYFPISVGVISVDELESRIYRAIKIIKGEREPENWSLYDFQGGGSVFDIKGGKKIYDDYVKHIKDKKRKETLK